MKRATGPPPRKILERPSPTYRDNLPRLRGRPMGLSLPQARTAWLQLEMPGEPQQSTQALWSLSSVTCTAQTLVSSGEREASWPSLSMGHCSFPGSTMGVQGPAFSLPPDTMARCKRQKDYFPGRAQTSNGISTSSHPGVLGTDVPTSMDIQKTGQHA